LFPPAVRADQCIACGLNAFASLVALKDRYHPVGTFPKIHQPAIGMNPSWAQPFDRRAQQHTVQLATVNADLRGVISGVEAAQFLPNGLAEAIGVDQFTRTDAGGIQGREQAERSEFLDRVRQHVDADAEFAELARLLADFDLDAALMQGERRGQAADPGACNNDFHDYAPRDS
jgi:hypothetical protein